MAKESSTCRACGLALNGEPYLRNGMNRCEPCYLDWKSNLARATQRGRERMKEEDYVAKIPISVKQPHKTGNVPCRFGSTACLVCNASGRKPVYT